MIVEVFLFKFSTGKTTIAEFVFICCFFYKLSFVQGHIIFRPFAGSLGVFYASTQEKLRQENNSSIPSNNRGGYQPRLSLLIFISFDKPIR